MSDLLNMYNTKIIILLLSKGRLINTYGLSTNMLINKQINSFQFLSSLLQIYKTYNYMTY
jgi:hypothetical protein